MTFPNKHGLPGCDCHICANERATGKFEMPAQTPPVYECSGCGRMTDDPVKDLAEMQARGFVSCCPERKMIAK